MTAEAVAKRTALHGPLITDVPFPMQIVRHVDDVVEVLCHLFDVESLEVPERRWGRDRQGLVRGQLGSHQVNEEEIQYSIRRLTARRSWNVNCLVQLPRD